MTDAAHDDRRREEDGAPTTVVPPDPRKDGRCADADEARDEGGISMADLRRNTYWPGRPVGLHARELGIRGV